jgi:hypothetical protein
MRCIDGPLAKIQKILAPPPYDDCLMSLARASSLPFATALAISIFLVDTLSSLQFAVASLYVVVVLVAAYDLRREGAILAGIACALLTLLSYHSSTALPPTGLLRCDPA